MRATSVFQGAAGDVPLRLDTHTLTDFGWAEEADRRAGSARGGAMWRRGLRTLTHAIS